MIIREDVVIVTKPQLRALGNMIYTGEDRTPCSGMLVDYAAERLAATDGHRAVVLGKSPKACRTVQQRGAFMLGLDAVKAALAVAHASSAIAIWRDDETERVNLSIIPKAFVVGKNFSHRKGSFTDALTSNPRACAEEAKVRQSAKPIDARFPPLHQVIPAGDWQRKTGTAASGFGSDYLADIATIGKSIVSKLAGGATCRVLMPTEKNALGPILFALDDMTLGAYWLYVVMPVRI